MSTITKEFTKEQLQQIIETDHVQCGEASSLARIALASLEAEPVGEVSEQRDGLVMDGTVDLGGASTHRIIKGASKMKRLPLGTKFYTTPPAPANAEPVAWLWSHRKHPSEVTPVRPEDDERAEGAHWSGWSCQALYASPPAPVSMPDALAEDIDSDDHPLLWSYNNGWNACRAAMLHGAEPVSQPDELPMDYLQGHKDGLEWAARLAEANHPQTGDWLYDDPLELAKAIRKGPDMPTSPVQGWIPCSERMPQKNERVIIFINFNSETVPPSIHDAQFTGSTFRRGNATVNVFPLEDGYGVTHWMPLPAAPQQEA